MLGIQKREYVEDKKFYQLIEKLGKQWGCPHKNCGFSDSIKLIILYYRFAIPTASRKSSKYLREMLIFVLVTRPGGLNFHLVSHNMLKHQLRHPSEFY